MNYFLFLAYKEAVENLDDKYQNCTDDEREKGSKPCVMDLTSLGECYNNSAGFQYGYDEEKPCIFMKMNRVSSCYCISVMCTGLQNCSCLLYSPRHIQVCDKLLKTAD